MIFLNGGCLVFLCLGKDGLRRLFCFRLVRKQVCVHSFYLYIVTNIDFFFVFDVDVPYLLLVSYLYLYSFELVFCGKKGHIERACQSKKLTLNEKVNPTKYVYPKKGYVRKSKKKHINQVEYTGKPEDESDENELLVVSVSSNSDGYWVTPMLDRKAIPMQADTGAAVSLVA